MEFIFPPPALLGDPPEPATFGDCLDAANVWGDSRWRSSPEWFEAFERLTRYTWYQEAGCAISSDRGDFEKLALIIQGIKVSADNGSREAAENVRLYVSCIGSVCKALKKDEVK